MTTLTDEQRNNAMKYIPQDLSVAIDTLIYNTFEANIKDLVLTRRLETSRRSLADKDIDREMMAFLEDCGFAKKQD